MPVYQKIEDIESPLHRLLLTAVPENDRGNKTITHLAKLLKIDSWSVYKWIRKSSLPPKRAKEVVEISRIVGKHKNGKPKFGPPRVTIEELNPFVYNV